MAVMNHESLRHRDLQIKLCFVICALPSLVPVSAMPRQKGTVLPSGNAGVDTKRCACINKILAFDNTIDYQNDFSFMFEPGVGSRPNRLIKHLISLDCLDNLDRIHSGILFPDSRPVTRERSRSPNPKKYTMYHGTNTEAAKEIEANGFQPSGNGMLGSGVYASRDIRKAMAYGPVVFEVSVDVGRVKRIDRQGHPLQKAWSLHGYDTAWVPPHCGMVGSGMEEDCVFDPERVTVVRRVDAYSFSSLATACRDVWLQAVANLPRIIALPQQGRSITCNAVLAACSERWQSAVSLMLSMATSAFQLSQVTYGICIAAVGNEVGGWMLAFNLFSKMVSGQLLANLIVYNSLLSACAQSSQWQLAAYLLMTMPKPDVVSFNSAIACRRPVMARSLLQRMNEETIEATLVTWNSCICSCSEGHWQLALHLLHCCMCHLQPDRVTCSAAMNACERGSQWQAALEIYTLSRGDVASSNAFISSCTRGTAWPLGLSLAAAVDGHATAVTHGSAVAACAAGGKYLLALNLLSQHPTVSGLGAALDACGSKLAWRHAVEVLRAARSWTLRADVAVWSCAAAACAASWSWALRVLEASPDSLALQLSVVSTVAKTPQPCVSVKVFQDLQANTPFFNEAQLQSKHLLQMNKIMAGIFLDDGGD
eukprot:s265_g41.t2